MAIAWTPSSGSTLGIEWEVQLIDAQTRLLRQDAGLVLPACAACRRAASTRRCATS